MTGDLCLYLAQTPPQMAPLTEGPSNNLANHENGCITNWIELTDPQFEASPLIAAFGGRFGSAVDFPCFVRTGASLFLPLHLS
jgi:hypothetical protein